VERVKTGLRLGQGATERLGRPSRGGR